MSSTDWADDAQQAEEPQEQGWQAGNYDGTFKSHELITSQIKGTPGIRLWFDVGGTDIPIDVWISEASSEIAIKQLAKVGWNGDFNNAEFDPPESVGLYMKKDTYKGKPQDRWSISTFERKAAPSGGDPVLKQFAARFKAQTKAAPAAPKTAPKGPAPSVNGKAPTLAPKASGAPKPSAAPPKPPKPAAAKETALPTITDEASAWSAWVAAKLESDVDGFWARIAEAGDGAEPADMTAEQWAKFAASIPPF